MGWANGFHRFRRERGREGGKLSGQERNRVLKKDFGFDVMGALSPSLFGRLITP